MASAEAIQSPKITPLLLPPAPDFHARFSREAYHRMIDTGIIDPNSRVELIDGEMFMMLPIGPPQGSYTSRLNEFFVRCIPETLQCRCQMPIVVGDHSEPEPDIAIVLRRDDDYQHEHPTPNEVVLLVEVAHSSLNFDLRRKMRLYASSGISEYWVVDVEHKSIHVHRLPTGNRYTDTATLTAGESLSPLAAASCQLTVEWLFR
jgi:Uma2 family endonuclease